MGSKEGIKEGILTKGYQFSDRQEQFIGHLNFGGNRQNSKLKDWKLGINRYSIKSHFNIYCIG